MLPPPRRRRVQSDAPLAVPQEGGKEAHTRDGLQQGWRFVRLGSTGCVWFTQTSRKPANLPPSPSSTTAGSSSYEDALQ